MRRSMLFALLRAHLAHPLIGLKTVRCLRAFRSAQEEIRIAPDANRPHPELQYTRTQQATGYSADSVRETVSRWMEREPLAFLPAAARPGMRDFFTWAASRGIQLAALSDYPLEQKLKALAVDDLFRLAVSASDPRVARFKPHPAILEFVLRELQLTPDRTLYVGDRPEVDGAVARRTGVPGVILSPRSNPGWRDGLLYVRSFAELRRSLEQGK
jgi:FMN phosphatase YigB (HAD superfamily)